MTSQASLVKINPPRQAFGIALREGAAAGIVSALLLGILVTMTAISRFNDPYSGNMVVYCFFIPDNTFAYTLFMALAGVAQGLFAFKLLFNRSAANTYFSLGLNRKQLFAARFAAGALWLAAGVLVAMAAGAAVNLLHAAPAGLVLARGLYLGAGLLATTLTAYAVTALVCALSGTLTESLIYSLLAVLLPTLVLFGLNAQVHAYLLGCPYGYSAQMDYVSGFGLPGSVFSELTWLNPLLFFTPYLDAHSLLITGQETLQAGAAPLSWTPVLGWFAAAAALGWLARRCFVARKVENTGIRGACKPLGFTVLLPAVYAAFTAFLPMLSSYDGWPPVTVRIAGTALSAAVFCALVFPLRLAERPLWKGLLPYPACLAAACAVTAVLLAGGFGYAGYVPAAGDVERVDISYKGLPGLVPGPSFGSGGLPILNDNGVIALTDPDDIALAVTLHQILLEDAAVRPGRHVDPGRTVISNYTLVRYTLKDGRTVQRFYRCASLDALGQMRAMDETAAFGQALDAMRSVPPVEPDPQDSFYNRSSIFAKGTVYCAAPLSTQALLLEGETAEAVRQAFLEDLGDQRAQDRYTPDEAERYILYFLGQWGFSPSSFPERAVIDELTMLGEPIPVAIGSAYPRTLALLAARPEQPESAAIEWISIGEPYANLLADYTMNPDVSPFFTSVSTSQQSMVYEIGDRSSERISDPVRIDDPVRIAELYAASRGFYLAGEGGVLIYVKLRDSDAIMVRYVPAALLPDWAEPGG